MMKKTKLAHAVSMALAGTALSLGAVSTANATVTTMYNMYRGNFAGLDSVGNPLYNGNTTPCAPCDNSSTVPSGIANDAGGWTDGWVWDANPQGAGDGNSTTPASGITPIGHTAANADPNRPGWVGIGGSSTPTLTTPFGYAAGGTLNWAIEMTGGAGGSGQISNADSISRYSQSADIDTAKGAWSDAALSGSSGWRHDLDYGLFKSDTSGLVTLSALGVNQANTNFGFTIFKGMNTSTTAYNHHGAWNANNNTQVGAPTAASVPATAGFNLTAANIVAFSVGGTTPSNLNTISFNAEAGQIYTIVLGGYKNGAWTDTIDGYKLNISQVPVPAAVWLFGSALAGMGVIGRRKQKATV